jgi:hypothetical protein
MGVWLGTVTLALIRWTSLTEGSQGRLLFPAIAPIATFFVLGLRAWFLPRVRDTASVILAFALLVLAAVVPWRWVSPQYARLKAVDRLPEGAVPLEIGFGDAITLRGIRFPRESAHPGEAFPVDLVWETSRELTERDEAMVWLRLIQESPPAHDPAGGVVGLEDSFPGAGTFPVSLWPVDQLLAGRQYVRVGPDISAPIVARLDVALYKAAAGGRLSHPGDDLPTVGRVKIVPRTWPRARRRDVVARFEPGISLAAQGQDRQARPGETFPVALTWTVQARPKRDYTVFVHLESGQGEVWGYGDGAPRQGNYPTSWWNVNEVIVEERGVSIAPDTPPGLYHVVVGLFGADGRVSAYDAAGVRWPGDAVTLGVVEVR